MLTCVNHNSHTSGQESTAPCVEDHIHIARDNQECAVMSNGRSPNCRTRHEVETGDMGITIAVCEGTDLTPDARKPVNSSVAPCVKWMTRIAVSPSCSEEFGDAGSHCQR